MDKAKFRDYEVSIWTLQDEFISVLKPSHLERKGQIEQGSFTVKDDGTQELTFSIPMYIYQGQLRVENPIWYNVHNGNLISNMRKIKLIFNKEDISETKNWPCKLDNVFEFLIVDVKERHENDQLWCDVSCEGLAFHELGKIGYKISLSSEAFYEDDYENFINNQPRLIANLQYWVEKFLRPVSVINNDRDSREWYYSVNMDWSSYDQSVSRSNDIIYEEPYTSSWEISETTGLLVPKTETATQEKERMVDLEESNYYNLTQNIAEIFGVFCKYCYLYDSNYHIVGREVIFYNNYVKENEGYLTLSYPFMTNAITREQDGKDLTTKMFVKSVDDEHDISGIATIMDVDANKSGEDYVLNFDYLYSIGAINKEQYEDIQLFESSMHNINIELIKISNEIVQLKEERIDVEARHTVAENSIPLDEKQIETASGLLNNLIALYGDEAGTGIEITNTSPESAVLLHNSADASNVYYLNVKNNGIVPSTLKIYSSYDYTRKIATNPIENYTLEYDDEYGDIISIKNIIKSNTSSVVYLTYIYKPRLYYDKVIRIWELKLAKDTSEEAETNDRLNIIDSKISNLENLYETTLANKKAEISKFEKMMGPALRESYWLPDDYKNYGDVYLDTNMYLINNTLGASGKTQFIWDTEAFDEEQLNYYKVGIENKKYYYPIASLDGNAKFVKENWDRISFIFSDETDDWYGRSAYLKRVRNYPINSLCQYGFVNNNNTVIPVLIFTGYEKLVNAYGNIDNDFITRLKRGKIGIYSVSINGSNVEVNIDNGSFNANFLNVPATNTTEFTNLPLCYPRIKIDSNKLKVSSDELVLMYNNAELKEFEDYSVLYKERNDAGAYYINLKPISIIKNTKNNGNSWLLNKTELSIKFSLSNASTSIYLDALKILKENSVPKVSYTITPSVIKNDEFLYTAYNKLNRICNINDYELKFKDAQGYISELHLNLDRPWEDNFEIKNYKNKFEDLFSTIVAQTQEMKKNSYNIEQIGTLLAAAENPYQELDSYILDSEAFQNYLKGLFDEAGKVLSSGSSALSNLYSVSEKNAEILASFRENIVAGLTPTVIRSINPPRIFKQGDIWIEIDNSGIEVARYVATSIPESDNPLSGWTKVNDGRLAAITGASLDIDAEQGQIDVKAANLINILSGNRLDIAAGSTVNITGNDAVNIGGTAINIGAYQYRDSNGKLQESLGGIHLVNSVIGEDSADTSKVNIDGTGIELASSNGIVIKSGAGIDIKSSDGEEVSAIRINNDEGIYLGSSAQINLFSGDDKRGANMQLKNDSLLLGVVDEEDGSVAKFTRDTIVLAVSGNENNITESSLTGTGASSGVLIERSYIGMAVESTSNGTTTRTSNILNQDGLTLFSGTKKDGKINGSTVTLSSKGLDLGSTGDLTVNTNNMQINTKAKNGDIVFALGSTNEDIFTPKLNLDGNGNLSISGTIIATSLYIGEKDDKNKLSFKDGIFSVGDTAINNDIIGGTNLFPKSAAVGRSYYNDSGIINDLNNQPKIVTRAGWHVVIRKWTSNDSNKRITFSSKDFLTEAIQDGEYYTLSFNCIAFGGNTNLHCDFYPDADKKEVIAGYEGYWGEKTVNVTKESNRIVLTGQLKTYNNPTTLQLRFWRMEDNNTPNVEIKIWDIKLEKGNKATDWSPAPEDLESDLESGLDEKASKTHRMLYSDFPTSNVRVGDMYIDSGTGIGYIAIASSGTKDNIYVRIDAGKINGTAFVIDAVNGNIYTTADNKIEIKSGEKLSLATNGELTISGKSGVSIGSGAYFKAASNNFIIK